MISFQLVPVKKATRTNIKAILADSGLRIGDILYIMDEDLLINTDPKEVFIITECNLERVTAFRCCQPGTITSVCLYEKYHENYYDNTNFGFLTKYRKVDLQFQNMAVF